MSNIATRLSSPFVHKDYSTSKLMLIVILALTPGTLLQTIYFGYGVVINLLLCSLFAVATEALILRIRKRPALTSLKDNSALLTGILLGLALPPTLPVWMTLVGVSFAIIFAKQLYGGLGHNPFNPAMVGYVLLLVSFPVEMSAWLPSAQSGITAPSFIESLQLILFSKTSSGLSVNDFRSIADGYSMATPLDLVKTEYRLGRLTPEIFSQEIFNANLKGWVWVNAGFLLGGVFLLLSKCIRWHIPLSVIAGISLCSGILHWYEAELYSPFWFHLLSGATMLGAFFIATDPVTASTTPKGRIIYGLGIGFIVVIIRTFGGYPEAMAFAVLLLNMAVPTIDHYTKPKVYGQQAAEAARND